nr:retrovirus-related Pol polyprotein from transposon TNT 1-94 [Tanacetum cinerariifolium]
MSKSFEALRKHVINLELALQQCKEQIQNDKAFKENQSNVFLKEREQYFEIQDLKAQLQDKEIAIIELKKLIEKMKGKYVETNFEKSLIIRQPNAFKSQRQSNLARRDNSIHRQLWVLKAHNGKSQAPNQFYDADLEVAFRKSTCYIRDLKGNDLLTGSHGTYLYSITFQDTSTPNPICLMAKALSYQAWLWHNRLSHLNFDTINLLSKNDIMIGHSNFKLVKGHIYPSFELGNAKQKSFHTKTTSSSKRRLQILHMDLCGPIWVESFNGKKYVLVIVDDYSRYTWTHFLRSKDETPKVLIDFLTLVQRGINAQVRTVRTDKGIKFLNKTLHAYFAKEGIRHETSTARTPKQNDVVERRNCTLVEAARTMLSAAKVPLLFGLKQLQQHVLFRVIHS